MTEHEPRSTPNERHGTPERMQRTAHRFEERISDGIDAARHVGEEISLDTARLIAHALGRAFGRASALAEFARTGDGTYEALRDEYLELLQDETTPPEIREWINWLGTHLVQRHGAGSGRRFMNEHLPPSLDHLLVETTISIAGERFRVHLPANLDTPAIATLEEELHQLDLDKDHALQAFLMLPDVNADAAPIMEAFHRCYIGTFNDEEDALAELSPLRDFESELGAWTAENGLPPEAVTLDHEALFRQLNEAYDLIEWKGRLYVFV